MSKVEDPILKNKAKAAVVKKPPINMAKLQNVRIIQKHLVYVIGLSSNISSEKTLSKFEYFGQYGQITKIVVNKTKAYNPNGPNGPSFSAYITYSTPQEASICILSIDNTIADEHLLRASFGTTKYCSFFLKSLDCPNKDCLYLHYLADESDIINRDDMNTNKNIFYEQQLFAIKIADIFNAENRKKILGTKKNKTFLPAPESIFYKDIVVENDTENKNYKKPNKYYDNTQYTKRSFNYDYYEDEYYGKDDYNQYYDDEEVEDTTTPNTKTYERETTYKKTDKILNCSSDTVTTISSGSGNSGNSTTNTANSLRTSKNLDGTNMDKNKSDHLSDHYNEKDYTLNKQERSLSEPNMSENTKYKNEIPKTKFNRKELFRKRDKSRFTFVDNEEKTNDENIIIPEFIHEILYNKISKLAFFKIFNFEEETNFSDSVLNEYKNNNPWAHFIVSNNTNSPISNPNISPNTNPITNASCNVSNKQK